MVDRGMTRRTVLGSLAGFGLSACGTSPTLDLFGKTIAGIGNIGRTPGYGIPDTQIDASPYASLGLRIGGNQPAVMILASIDGDELHWASADRVVFVTRRGRLVKTVGLPRDLAGTQWAGSDPLSALPSVPIGAEAKQVYRYIDVRPQDDFGVPIESRFDVQGDEALTLLGRRHDTVRVRERVTVRKWRWSTENIFWIDKTSNRVWKSRQQFCPDVPAVTLEVLKPAGET